MSDERRANEVAWDLVASKFAPDLERDVEFLRGGGSSLLPAEQRELAPLFPACRRAIHVQCSHGQDALSIWLQGVREVVGVDFSAEMLALARRKGELLGANARWHQADVLALPAELGGTADLVYTGKGALFWVADLGRWASGVAHLLVPGGFFYVFEGHPLNWVWEPESRDLELRDDADYFARRARVNRDFPGKYLAHATPPGEPVPPALERQWPLGEVVSALVGEGLRLIHLREHPEHFWPQFPRVPAERARRVPQTFSLLMQAAEARADG